MHAKSASAFRGFLLKHPVGAFVVGVTLMSWIILPLLLAAGLPLEPGLIVLVLVGLLGGAVAVTRVLEGGDGVKRFFSAVFRWKFAPGYYFVALCSLPILTTLVALAIGTYRTPDSWFSAIVAYLTATVLTGALVINLWEEAAWAGFVQARLTARHGMLKGALLTAVGFAAIHFPLAFQQHGLYGTTVREFLAINGLVIAVAVIFRYLIGMVLRGAGGSILAVGLLHASFNSSNKLGWVKNPWASVFALVLLTLLLAAYQWRYPSATAK
jgi:membrane protease YdiL (CAAX protease family)